MTAQGGKGSLLGGCKSSIPKPPANCKFYSNASGGFD